MAEVSEPCLPSSLTEDDSCITQYIEIVPLDTTRCDYCDDLVSEIKQEPLDDIQQEQVEVQEVCDVKDIYPAAEVRWS